MDIEYFGSADAVAALAAQRPATQGFPLAALLTRSAWYERWNLQRAAVRVEEAQALLADRRPSDDVQYAALDGRLMLVRAEAKAAAQDLAAARALVAQARRRFEAADDAVGMGDAHLVAALVAEYGGDVSLRNAAREEARRCFERAGEAVRQRLVDMMLAREAGFVDPAAARLRWGAAVEACTAHDDPAVCLMAERCLATWASQSGASGADSVPHYQAAYEWAQRIGHALIAAEISSNLVTAFNTLNRPDLGLEWGQRALAHARTTERSWVIGTTLSMVACGFRRLGRFDAAKEMLAEAIELSTARNNRNWSIVCNEAGQLARAQGDHPEALRWHVELVRVGQHLDSPIVVMEGLTGQARALSELGRPGEAVAAIEQALAPGTHAGSSSSVHRSDCLSAYAEIARKHALPVPAGSPAPSAAIHWLEAALASEAAAAARTASPEWLAALSRDYEAVGDLARALVCERRATAAREAMATRQAEDLATVMQVHHQTERARAEAQHHRELAALEARRADAEAAANTAKSEFVANMSHELRSPLNALLGFTRLLQREPSLSERARHDLEIVRSSGEHLHRLINEVLEASKAAAGQLTLQLLAVDLMAMLDELRAMFSLSARQKGLALEVSIDRDTPQWVLADAIKLRQVLINLLGNAIKFTERGRVRLRVECAARRLKFAVIDSGVGIDGDDLQRLGEAFVQAGAGRRAAEGTGLGLAISRSYVALMGGELMLTSVPHEGTTAAITLPLQVVEAGDISAQRRVARLAPNTPPQRVLVVDDKPHGRQLLARLLEPLGFEVREAANGLQAVEACAQWAPHLVCMDMRMPVMDGREATRRIKAERGGSGIVIVALTASNFEEERQAVLACGCDDFMRKPFHEEALLELIARHLRISYAYEDDMPPPEPEVKDDRLQASLTALPGTLRQALSDALGRLDVSAIEQAIEAMTVRDENLGHGLAALAARFEYQRLRTIATQAVQPTSAGR
ncbi:response regulator [Aquincola sp. S2]|uniref:histidine kinase n=1 Tax=Pseudaquabacterium terrae TaxID=2732868 RepID=A0ABX2EIL5_9BURK|nr:ATP-binding protein [Aquabacterium terrae]NRF68440.1 response regulator [Aquabacterium terrae]